ncbi:MAG TPA: HEAT repeat domain-containing protein [Candidatus Binataceae bacterium]|nr:HEAT repeat domain-containing protein [Candidatus Binataceae bacterium]
MSIESDAILASLRSSRDSDRLNTLMSIIASGGENLSDEAIEAIAACLTADSKTIRRRAADALGAIGRHNSNIVALIRPGLNGASPRIRFGTAYALGTIDGALDLDAAPALCEALGDSDGDVRWAAAELIVRLGPRDPHRVRNDLLELLGTGNAPARKMALYCIRDLELTGDEVLCAASSSSRDQDSHVRLAALALLATSFANREEAIAQMLERLEADGDAGVRRAAAIALGASRGGSERVAAALRNASRQSADESLARAARSALDRIGRA